MEDRIEILAAVLEMQCLTARQILVLAAITSKKKGTLGALWGQLPSSACEISALEELTAGVCSFLLLINDPSPVLSMEEDTWTQYMTLALRSSYWSQRIGPMIRCRAFTA